MSKSRGTGISPLKYLAIGMNAEWLRYYIAAKLNSNVEDVDFIPDDFIARVNSDLIGKYVNIASRCAGFISKKFGGKLGAPQFRREIALPTATPPRKSPLSTKPANTARPRAGSWNWPTWQTSTRHPTSPWDLARQAGQEAQVGTPCARPRSPCSANWTCTSSRSCLTATQAEKLLNVEPMVWAEAWKRWPPGTRSTPTPI